MAFEPGDVVTLKSGGHSMTAVSAGDEDVDCLWVSDDGELFRQSIPVVALTAVEIFGSEEAVHAQEQADEEEEDEQDQDDDEEDDDEEDDDEDDDDEEGDDEQDEDDDEENGDEENDDEDEDKETD